MEDRLKFKVGKAKYATLFQPEKRKEMKAKHEILPQDIEWHFIGHLQTNKVKYIAPYVSSPRRRLRSP